MKIKDMILTREEFEKCKKELYLKPEHIIFGIKYMIMSWKYSHQNDKFILSIRLEKKLRS